MFDDQNLGNPITASEAAENRQPTSGQPTSGQPTSGHPQQDSNFQSEQPQQDPNLQPQQDSNFQDEQPRPPQVSSESNREYNFRQLRERAEQAERRNQEYERALRAKEASQFAPKQEEAYPDLADDGLVEGKHLKHYSSSVDAIKSELAATKKQLEAFHATSAELQLRAKFSDFDRIVTDENIERLAREKPALYRSILANPDLKDKGEIAYEAITQYFQPQRFAKQDQRIAENKAKPRSSSTVSPQASDSPLARAGDYDRRSLSESRKAELHAEMQEARSRM